MHEYYFKIKKGDIEFECSTSDKFTFEEKLSEWINGVVNGAIVAPPQKENDFVQENAESEKPERSDFIDVKSRSSINELSAPALNVEFSGFSQKDKDIQIPEINFEDALNASMSNPTTEVVEKKEATSEFEDYINSFNPESQLDYLIVSSTFILNKENQERFTLKQINSKIVPLTGKPVDHSTIQEAMQQELVRVVPDLTQTSEVTEYTLTEQGEGYFVM